MLYCPKCLDTSIQLESKGVVHFIINGKHQDTSQLLFNLEKDEQDEFVAQFAKKIDEFMCWYKQFKNRKPISSIQVFTNNYRCKNGCTFTANLKFSVVDILLPAAKIIEIVHNAGKQHGIEVELQSEDIVI